MTSDYAIWAKRSLLMDMTQVAQMLKLGVVVQFDDVLMSENLADSVLEVEGYRAVVSADGFEEPTAAVSGPEEIEEALRHCINEGSRNLRVICFENWLGLVFEHRADDSWAETSVLLVHAR